MNIAIALDHGAVEFKSELMDSITALGHTVVDFGAHSDDDVDYPDYAIPLCEAVADGEYDRGILAGTTGIGMNIVANKVTGIRASLVYDTNSAILTRRHFDSNVLCLGADLFDIMSMKSVLSVWLSTLFDGGRHQRRVDKYPELLA